MQGRGLVKVPAYFIDFIEDLIMKFKLYRSYFRIYTDWWAFPFVIMISIDEPVLSAKNFQISIHFLCCHAAWKWIEKEINL